MSETLASSEMVRNVLNVHAEPVIDQKQEADTKSMYARDTLRPSDQQRQSNKIIRAVQYISVVVSISACIYFVYNQLVYVALQYAQVCFISVLTLVLDSSTYWRQRLWLLLAVLAGTGWGAVTIWEGYRYEDFHTYDYVVGVISGIVFFGSMIYSSYVCVEAAPLGKRVELDLLLYLVSLNAICFFTPAHSFNSNLHMILDIRTMMLLFNGLFQPKDKMDLLRCPSFLVIMLLIISSFIISSSDDVSFGAIISSMYVVIGGILMREAYLVHVKCTDCHCSQPATAFADTV